MLISFFMGDFSTVKVEQVPYSEFVQYMNNGEVKSVTTYEENQAQVELNDGKKISVVLPSKTMFIDLYHGLVAEGKGFVYNDTPPTETPWWVSLLPTIAIVVIFILFWVFFLNQAGSGGGGKVMSFGKSRAKLSNGNEKNKITFNDVAGVDEEKEELQEIVEFLKYPKKFVDMGARIPKGVLLVGPPGTGKTLLAKAVAGEAGVPFFSISGSDFVEMFVGVGASRVRDLFDQAKKSSPCIIFIDEIDAVGRQRGAGVGGGHDEREQTLNQLLVEMDGFGANEGVIILAATNRPDVLDPALLRPGRFDRQVVVGAPDILGREAILKVHARKKPLDADVDLNSLAKNTAGFSGADLENMLNEAALLAARRNKNLIGMSEIEDAMVKVIVGTEKKSRVVTEKERRLTAYHEAGHAVVSKYLPTQDPVHQVSIIPRGRAGGYTMYRPNEDKSYRSKTEMEESIVSLLGGRVAEKMILDDISTGASNDLQRATETAKNMVTKFGMSELLGPMTFGDDNDEVFLGRGFAHSRTYSEEIAKQIDSETKRIIQTAYDRAQSILTEHIGKLHAVAEKLLEKEKIDGEEFNSIFE
ncbi:MAG: ATP-dependent metallopeptidase FtsH/Yme1/Tma family protein [Clostridiales bacterium]|nr:ATP-dependent metallopeptidase FtsH/Yme1/Tma family protein [Clostridiales bacterium]